MMRQIIRSYLAPHVAPTLAYSSFEAWRGLSVEEPAPNKGGLNNPVVAGFMAQFATIKAALEATIERAVNERHDLIVDGVHVIPTELDLAEASQKAIIVPIMLVVTTRERLARQLVVRSRDQPERRAFRYLQHLDDIWELQSYLLKLADKAGIPEIANWNIDDTIDEILNEVNRKISEHYPPDPHTLA
jgi:2-phosphoglycerate kinase